MLSRIAARSLGGAGVRFTSTSATQQATATPAAAEERDLVNFPDRKAPIYPHPVRLGFIPQAWFDAFYEKTGVSGPYMFGIGAFTFLYSKEIYVYSNETWQVLQHAFMLTFAAKWWGPRFTTWLNGEVEKDNKELNDLKTNKVDALNENIDDYAVQAEQLKNHCIIFDAKKENVALQLEAAYRERLQEVHAVVKNRLDYQLETSNTQKQFEQKHMVDWIVNSVQKAITPEQEAASLKQCIADLNKLALAKA